MIALLLAVVFSANQGSVVQITIPDEDGIKSAALVWETQRAPMEKLRNAWTTILGVDLDRMPGEHKADLQLTMLDGRIETREAVIKVVEKEYPTTELKVAEQFVQLSDANLARATREAEETDAIFKKVTPEALWQRPFASPIPGRKGTNFGHRRVFNGEPRAPHGGADLRATTGTPIQSTNRGRVVLAKNLFFTGNTVILDHGLGIYSLYAHLSRIDVARGTLVNIGQRLGLAGATGRVTGPHLHWAIRAQGARVDPFTLVGIGAIVK